MVTFVIAGLFHLAFRAAAVAKYSDAYSNPDSCTMMTWPHI